MQINILISIAAGLATAIPLIIKLVSYVQAAAKEKNWNVLLAFVMQLMTDAEHNENLLNGAERKHWVLQAVQSASNTINYDIDIDAIDKLIDSLSGFTKNVNIEQIVAEETNV